MKKFKVWFVVMAFIASLSMLKCAPVEGTTTTTSGGDTTTEGGGGTTTTVLTIANPASGASVGTPFTISGVKSDDIASVTVTGGTASKTAVINGSNWSVTYSNGQVNLGNISFTATGRDSNNTSLTNVSISLNVTNNGSGSSTVTLSGTLLSNYASGWEVFWTDSWSNPPITADGYGTVNTSDGTYTISIAENQSSIAIIAFRDDNANGTYDSGENSKIGHTNLAVVTNDISGLDIEVPLILTYIIKGSVTGNTWGKSMGAVAFNMNNGNAYHMAPTNVSSFSYSIDLTGGEGNALYIGYYFDDDGDGDWHADLVNSDFESMFLFTNFTVSSLTNTLDMTLVTHEVTGNITGDDATSFDLVNNQMQGAFIINASVTSGSYAYRYYAVTEMGSGQSNTVALVAGIDADDNLRLTSGEATAKASTMFKFANTVATNATLDMNIKKYALSGAVLADSGNWKLANFLGYGDKEMLYDVQPSPYTWTNYIVSEAGSTNEVNLYAFNDVNDNSTFEGSEPNSAKNIKIYSDTTSASADWFMTPYYFTATNLGDFSSASSPLLMLSGTCTAFEPFNASDATVSLTNWYNTNTSFSLSYNVYDDTDGDGSTMNWNTYSQNDTIANWGSVSTFSNYIEGQITNSSM